MTTASAVKLYDSFHSDKYGSVKLRIIGNILVSQFEGPCGVRLAKYFKRDVIDFVSVLESQPWAYMSISNSFEAATTDALAILTESFLACANRGCRAEAYVMRSPIARHQVNAMRSKAGLEHTPDIFFADYRSARRHLNTVLVGSASFVPPA
ncbi:hypothetical protein FJ444_12860 [Aestuariibacter sp. GS-14]|uniref:hypothetical protein n=1 Tax=Alteromonadaceae TaxID=72275 RepID=UPI001128A1D5|nr:hypothetical protein [Aestuariibacter sp. GS-14]TPV57283.1 hypothetical protein FJ444_12860 [Aestuariibacter sp. GS-14]